MNMDPFLEKITAFMDLFPRTHPKVPTVRNVEVKKEKRTFKDILAKLLKRKS